MLITNLLPLLARYSLGLDLVAGPDGIVTLTVMPRKAEGAKHALAAEEIRPISITASAEEIDAELALGEGGALGQLFVARKTLAEQLAAQRATVESAKAAATPKAKPAAAKAPVKADPEPATPADEPEAGGPASLW